MSSFPFGISEVKNGPGVNGGKRSQQSNSLVKFKEAKKEMQKILSDLSSYVDECREFLTGIRTSEERFHSVLPPGLDTRVDDFSYKLKAIQEIIERNQMKCAFFGRTSNGKSTVINAMLGNRLLPSGIGHTTNCFLQVEGTDQEHGYIVPFNETQPQPVDSIRDLAHALSGVKLAGDSIIHIFWPNSRCALLREEVAFLDSPGVDIDPDMDSWIDKHCMDADVFILVANAESTLMQAEKHFFHKVSEKLSKPNIFILNNRWDASAMEMEYVAEVREQHTERCKDFLVKELQVCTKEEADERVFFVSAKEVLITRSRQDSDAANGASRGADSPGVSFAPGMAEGWQTRLMEFNSFESIFQKILSESAIKTKFSSHAMQCRETAAVLRKSMETMYETCVEEKDAAMKVHQLSEKRLESIRANLLISSQDVDASLSECLATVEQKVAETLHEEIRQLDELVNHFQRPFHADSELRLIYKKELNEFVERTLGTRLEEACTKQLAKEVSRLESYMLDTYQNMAIDEVHRSHLPSLIGKSTFRPVFHIDCRNICADFQEDVAFRFSLGLSNLMLKFIHSSRTLGHTAPSPFGRAVVTASGDFTPAHLLPTLVSTFPSLISRNSVGAVVVLGVVVRATGWRVLALCGAVYGGLFLYEWLSWTNKAKERAFKRQYTEYASNKLRLIVDLTSTNVSHQVRQEITSCKSKLHREVEDYAAVLRGECDQVASDILKLEQIATEAKKLKNVTNFLDNCLVAFQKNFIATVWPRAK